MMPVRDGCVLGGDVGGHGVAVGHVVGKRPWGFVLVGGEVYDMVGVLFAGRGNGKRDCSFAAASVRLLCLFGRSFLVGVSAIEVGDKFWGVFQMLHGFPRTVARGESLPLY